MPAFPLDAQTLVIYTLLIALPIAFLTYHYLKPASTVPHRPPSTPNSPDPVPKPLKNIMQPPRADLLPPLDTPYTLAQLKEFDGSDPSKPIYVSIKGTVFDVSAKKDVYGPGKSYSVFAGNDGSKGLGMSSLNPEHAVADYSGLSEGEMKVLNDWHDFFSKRYNVVGRVIDLPVINT